MAVNPANLLGALKGPGATFLSILEWQILGQVLSAVMAPYLAGVAEEMWKIDPSLQLSVADAVEAVIKSHWTEIEGEAEAALSGVSAERFRILVAGAGEPPALDFLAEAYRRGFIPKSSSGAGDTVSLEQGIRESRLKNKWIPTVELMQYRLAPVGAIVEGWLRAQITEAEARDLLNKNGVDDATATLLYKSAGRPPGPMELIELTRRGIIPEAGEGGDTLSLRQGYLETDLKNKWYQPWTALMEYLPPPRTITALQRAGSITDTEALDLYKKSGLSDHLAAVYVKTAHHERSATTRELTKAELTALYEQQAIDAAELTRRLIAKGYTAADAALELELADLKIERTLLGHAVTRVGSLYVGRRIDKAQAQRSLDGLKMPAPQRDRLLQVWDLERQDNLKHLTAAEIGAAVRDAFFTVEEGLAELGKLGYGPRDAWISLSIHLKGAATATMPTDNLPPP